LEGEEPFVFVIENMDSRGKIRERLMSCLERKSVADGIMETLMLSKRERSPVLCVTGKHLTPYGVYDRYVLVLPSDARLVDDEGYEDEEVTIWEINGEVYAVRTIYDPSGFEKTIVQKLGG